MKNWITCLLRAMLLLGWFMMPLASHALGCWSGRSSDGAVKANLTLPDNLYVAANIPVGTVIWQSPLQSISLYCTQSIGENVYFWVNPKKQTLASGVTIGIIFNGVTYTQNSGAIDTGIYVPWNGWAWSNLQYSIVLIKSDGAPSSGSVTVSQYPVFQLDGIGGINSAPNINFNQLITGTVNFTPGGTCNLSTNGRYTINLPTVGASQFAAVGSTLARSYLTINASNCSKGVRTATFIFSGIPDSDNPVLFANSGGSAKGVAINLGSSADGANIGANTTNNTRVVNVQGQSAQLGVFAEYVRTNTVVPGSVQTAVTINMLYQ